MKIWILLVAVWVPLYVQAAGPVPEIKHAVIISVDGMRPDLAMRSNMPNLRKLMASGSFSMWAQTTEVSVTLPSHTSMLTGVPPEIHGITFNDDGPVEPVHPKVPSIFELAHKGGYTTAMIVGKSKLGLIALPESLDIRIVPERGHGMSDDEVADAAVRIIIGKKPGLTFIHFASTDGVGHGKGWGSKEYVQNLERVDENIGRVVDAVEKAGMTGSTMVIVNADHGGRRTTHGPNDPRSRHIPWIATGPGIRANNDLDMIREQQVSVEDTFGTACAILGLEVEGEVKGQLVKEILITAPATNPAMVPVTTK